VQAVIDHANEAVRQLFPGAPASLARPGGSPGQG
jgi:hypothetical protein